MVEREKVLTVLLTALPGATQEQVAAAANAIVGLEDDWEEVTSHEPDFGITPRCSAATSAIADCVQQGDTLRVFRKKAVTM
jgi:hypothetical protein